MKPQTILYVDDETMALKYFERLVSPLAPVLVANSVAQGKEVLREHGERIAVLVSDQRMPGANGNELLSFAREHYPAIVRLLTTAYSELDEAIEAINAGEIYRYITKPWDMGKLRADLKNALELAALRNERDGLLREKMIVQQQQLLSQRACQLALLCSGHVRRDFTPGLAAFLDAAAALGCTPAPIDWQSQDYTDVLQAEARRGIAIGELLAAWQPGFGQAGGADAAARTLAAALPAHLLYEGDARLSCPRPAILTDLLCNRPDQAPTRDDTAWLAWLLWWNRPVEVQSTPLGARIHVQDTAPVATVPDDWLAQRVGRLQAAPA